MVSFFPERKGATADFAAGPVFGSAFAPGPSRRSTRLSNDVEVRGEGVRAAGVSVILDPPSEKGRKNRI